jgi:signal transduction histidine kinase/ActR/RegA family two-component response regulator
MWPLRWTLSRRGHHLAARSPGAARTIRGTPGAIRAARLKRPAGADTLCPVIVSAPAARQARTRGVRARSRVRAALAGLVLAALASAPAAAQGTGPGPQPVRTFVYGGDAEFPPYEYLDTAGNPAGFNIELIRAISDAAGLRVTVKMLPWSQVRAGLASGTVDVAAMYRSTQRAREVEFAIPHELVYHEMFIRPGSPPLLSTADLAGKRVLVETGTYSADALSELGLGIEIRRVASEPEAIRDLAAGLGDVAIVTETVGRPFRARSLSSANVVPTGPPILLSEYAFVTRKGNRALIERLNDGVMAVKASGDYDRLYDRWLRPGQASRYMRLAAWALLVAIGVVLLVVTWNRSLRRVVTAQTESLRREYAEKEQALTALAEREQSLRQAQKMEVIGRLAGGVAHDFNNLLTIILSYAQLLRMKSPGHGQDSMEVDEIMAASERAARLTRQLLAFSRATPVETIRLDLCTLIPENLAMLQRLVGDHISVESSLPAARVTVEAETTQIEQILLNLAANARDAMPDGGTLRIDVGTILLERDNPHGMPQGPYATLRVSDSGVGMDAETRAHIFEPFFTTKETGKGTGLGLATVFAHTTRMRGRIFVDSTPGAGTTFQLLIPACDASELDTAQPVVWPDLPAAAPERILLVEDDEALRRTALRILERAGHHVQEARDGEEALGLALGGESFTMIVTDVVMPRMTGPRLVEELRRHVPRVYVLYVSGYVEDGTRLDVRARGTAFLPKPYTPVTLLDAVQRLAAIRRRDDPLASAASSGASTTRSAPN